LYSEEEIWKVYNTLHIGLFVLFLCYEILT